FRAPVITSNVASTALVASFRFSCVLSETCAINSFLVIGRSFKMLGWSESPASSLDCPLGSPINGQKEGFLTVKWLFSSIVDEQYVKQYRRRSSSAAYRRLSKTLRLLVSDDAGRIVLFT